MSVQIKKFTPLFCYTWTLYLVVCIFPGCNTLQFDQFQSVQSSEDDYPYPVSKRTNDGRNSGICPGGLSFYQCIHSYFSTRLMDPVDLRNIGKRNHLDFRNIGKRGPADFRNIGKRDPWAFGNPDKRSPADFRNIGKKSAADFRNIGKRVPILFRNIGRRSHIDFRNIGKRYLNFLYLRKKIHPMDFRNIGKRASSPRPNGVSIVCTTGTKGIKCFRWSLHQIDYRNVGKRNSVPLQNGSVSCPSYMTVEECTSFTQDILEKMTMKPQSDK